MITLQNEHILISIAPKGAELQRLYNKQTGLDYMWRGDPAYWGKYSPVLFPIVGSLKDGHFVYGDKQYPLSRHGFARDMVFEVEEATEDRAVFKIESNESTLEVYPFHFVFRLVYILVDDVVHVQYVVENPSFAPIYFSVGGHPAFKVPLVAGTCYEDYYLDFGKPVTASRTHLEDKGLLNPQAVPFLNDQQQLPLSPALFAQDAIVLTGVDIDTITLGSDKTANGLEFTTAGWPDLGIWAAPSAPFVCIEPWCGFADYATHNQVLEQKNGIIKLDGNQQWEKSWAVRTF